MTEPETTEEPIVTLFDASEVASQLATRDQEWQAKLDARDAEIDSLKTTSNADQVSRSLTNAATVGRAFNVESVLAILEPKTKIKDGKPLVEIEGFHMSPTEAVEWMRGQPDRFGNLFLSNAIGGLGGNSTASGSRGDYLRSSKDLSPEQYRKLKKDDPQRLFGGGR